MQYGVEERTIRNARMVVIKYFKCREEGHKCRWYPLWERKMKRVACPKEEKAHQGERRPVCPIREKAQKGEKKLRRVEKGKATRPVQREAQQGEKRSLMEELKKKIEEHCGKGVPREA